MKGRWKFAVPLAPIFVVVLAMGSFSQATEAQDLSYTGSQDAEILQNQVNVTTTVPETYYSLVANDWGYGGIQMNTKDSARTVLFSLWDQNNEESIIYAFNSDLPIVKNGRFGGEGTGVQFLFKYPWKFGTDYRAALRMFREPDGIHARVSGFFYDGHLHQWTYAATERANTGGIGVFKAGGFYSFAETYGGVPGDRDATMNNAWSYESGHGWTEYAQGAEFNNLQQGNSYGGVLTGSNGFEFKSGTTPPAMRDWTTVTYVPTQESPLTIPFNLSCGSAIASDNWEPDGYYSDNAGDSTVGAIASNVQTKSINVAAPQSVYQSYRTGSNFQYNLFGFIPNSTYQVQLEFVEPTTPSSGSRIENVLANGVPILSNFDVRKAAGGQNRAIGISLNVQSDALGKIVLQFTQAQGSKLPAIITAIATAPAPDAGTSASLAPNNVVFPTQTVGIASAPQNVILTNTGVNALAIGSINVTGPFAQTNNCGSTLVVGASCTIAVTFAPLGNGSATGALTVVDNASNGMVSGITLSGIGTGGLGPANGTYTVVNLSSGLLWDDPGSSMSAMTNVDLYQPTGNPNQKWTFTSLGNGLYEIVNAYSGLSLNVPGSSQTPGTLLIQYPYQGSSNEIWSLTPSGKGYVISSQVNGLAVDPSSNASGAYIQQQPADGSQGQVWVIQ